MATVVIYPEVARVLHNLLGSLLNGEFEAGQLTLTDWKGVPVNLLIECEQEVDDE